MLGKACSGLVVVLVLWALGAPPVAAGDRRGDAGPPRLDAESFARPSQEVRPKFRWWWPLAHVDDAELVREIEAMADAGAGGAEVAGFPAAGVDSAQYGWGTAAWNERVATALNAAKRYGLKLDFTLGPLYPIASPSVTDTNDAAAARYLVYGSATVPAGTTFSGPAPESTVPAPAGARSELVATTVARCQTSCSGGKPVILDPDSVRDVTNQVEGGAITWTAPGDGDWRLFAFWERPTGQVLADVTETRSAYVVDHFSTAGTKTVTDYWDERTLTPAVRRLLREAGSAVFGDSLELYFSQPFGGAPVSGLQWTESMPATFRRLRGYQLAKYLPVMFISGLHSWSPLSRATPNEPADFDFPGSLGKRLRNDYYEALTQLHVENHLEPLREWSRRLGLELRYQPTYGAPMSMADAVRAVDIPETESLHFGNDVNRYRTMAGAVHLSGARVFSVECCPNNFGLFGMTLGAYGQTWADMLTHLNESYAAGVNQAVYHGFGYADAPGATWPGYNAFGPGFSEYWGPRQPTWGHMADINGYVARQQLVLRQGEQKVDVAVYRHSYYEGTPITSPGQLFTAPNLLAAGYTYEYVGPGSLGGVSSFVRGGRLAPRGPAYRALVLARQQTLTVGAARQILRYARAGLPIVMVGAPPAASPFAGGSAEEDAAVAAAMEAVLARPNVRRVDSEAEVLGALEGLGVEQSARYAQPSALLNVRRGAADADYYYLYNPSSSAEHTTVSLEGAGAPHRLDAWTGAIEPVARYQREAGRVAVPVSLAPRQTTIIALRRWRHRGGSQVLATDADEVRSIGGRLVVRDTEPGVYETTLASGRTARTRIARVPEPRALTAWRLEAEDWQPGPTATETLKTTQALDLPQLAPWPALPELQDSSGIGRYRTVVELDAARSGGWGAYLTLGSAFDTVRVTVNGRRLPPLDQTTLRADLGGYLVAGRNTIVVEVATTLRNRLRLGPGPFAARPRQPYGLTGPAQLVPYGEAEIDGDRPGARGAPWR